MAPLSTFFNSLTCDLKSLKNANVIHHANKTGGGRWKCDCTKSYIKKHTQYFNYLNHICFVKMLYLNITLFVDGTG